MPDVHAGKGATIGTTMTLTDKAVPNLVGVDIGCGMLCIKLKDKRIDLPKLDKTIHELIPAGMKIRSKEHRFAGQARIADLACARHVLQDRAALSIGTLGSGNHFIEIDSDDDGSLYLIIHSGSRHLGVEVASHYQKIAGETKPVSVPFELAYVEGQAFQDYLHDMKLCAEYAVLNRHDIADEIMKAMKLKAESEFTTIHNYIDTEHRILRKGSVSAQAGERLLIPLNMRDGSLICTGKGNDAWNCSAPHGAGRLLSRTQGSGALPCGSAYDKGRGCICCWRCIGAGRAQGLQHAFTGHDVKFPWLLVARRWSCKGCFQEHVYLMLFNVAVFKLPDAGARENAVHDYFSCFWLPQPASTLR